MKDLPLSVLSRGCGQFVQCDGEQHGRLDVCFTPEDYYIWKAHGPLLRLSTSGCMHTLPESTLPKTFSTRRGALLLYSQGLVTLKTCPSKSEKDFDGTNYGQCSAQPVEQGENTTIKLKQSILNYSGVNALQHPHPPDIKYSESLHCHQELTSNSALLAQRESKFEDGHKRRIDVFLQMPSVTADTNDSGNNMEDISSEDDKDLIIKNPLQTSVEQIQQEGVAKAASGKQPLNSHRNIDQGKTYEDKAFPKQSNTRRSEHGFLPPLKAGQPLKFESSKGHMDKVRSGSFKEQRIEHLPLIEETRDLSHKPSDVKPLRNIPGPQQPFLPRLVLDKYEEKAQNPRQEKTLHSKHETWRYRIIEGRVSENSHNILLNVEKEYIAPFGLLSGKRGPGHQSSLAFLEKLSEESSDPRNMGVVRGVLPLELRDLNGQSVGTLILGPDGEIIQLSMFDNIQHSAQEQALEVVSAKGEKLPWVVMLQPEHNLTEMQQDHCCNKLSDVQGSGTALESVKANFDTDAMGNSDLKKESVIKTSIKSPIQVENTVQCLSSLDETEVETKSRENSGVEDKKDIRSGQLDTTTKPNEMPPVKIKTDDAALQNVVKDTKKLTKLKGTEERAISNKEKSKDTRSNPNRKVASGKEREDRVTASRPFSGSNNKNKTPATNTNKGVKGKETKTRDIKKTNDKNVNQDHFDAKTVSSAKNKKKKRGKFKNKDIQSAIEAINSSEDFEEEANEQRNIGLSDKQEHDNTKSESIEDGADTDRFTMKEPRLNSDQRSRSLRSLTSGASGYSLKHSSSQKSLSSSCESETPQGISLPLSRSRLSSCSTVMIPEERLILNPTKSEVIVAEQFVKHQEDKATVLEAEKLKIQRQKEERKRREEEEVQRQQQQKEELEQRMRNELQNERQKRAEQIRLKKQTEEEEKQRREEEEQRRVQREQERREREIRRQQEQKRQLEYFQRKREEEEQRRKAETDRLKLLEEKRLQEENIKLQEMTVSERAEYLCKKKEENDKREREEEERRRREEAAALLAAEKAKMEEELLEREMALLHQRLSFRRGLVVDSEGLEMSQGISRPWTYSYFTLLQLLSLPTAGERHT